MNKNICAFIFHQFSTSAKNNPTIPAQKNYMIYCTLIAYFSTN